MSTAFGGREVEACCLSLWRAKATKKGECHVSGLAIQKLPSKQNRDESALARSDVPSDMDAAVKSVHETPVDDCVVSCLICPANDLSLCAGARQSEGGIDWASDKMPLASALQTIPARRTICHPKEWSEFIPIICQGWAASSITLLDGRRQILSFLLPGDLVSTACLLEPVSGRTVEAITDVTCRKFSRNDLKNFIFQRPNLVERLSKTWLEERTQADQLALDLGRRTADERIARLILNLAERLAKRAMVAARSMDFPLRQRHIADATGLTPVHVSKVLGEFQRAGLIEINRRRLTIVNETELRRVADWR